MVNKKKKQDALIEDAEGNLVKPYCENSDHNGRFILGDGSCVTRAEANRLMDEHYDATGHSETDYFTC